jgi:hypothetical protein
MPLHDHFRRGNRLPWPSLFNGWAGQLVEAINRQLPEGFVAHEFVVLHGDREIGGRHSVTPLTGVTVEPRAADRRAPIVFPESVEVRVRARHHPELHAVLALVTPTNKATRAARFGLAARCVAHLQTGAAVALVDVVTGSEPSVHSEVCDLLGIEPVGGELASLTAVAYALSSAGRQTYLDVWIVPLAVGEFLPTLPFRATTGLSVQLDLESTYAETCRRRKCDV